MSMILKKPSANVDPAAIPTPHEVARFISDGDKRPAKGKAVSRTYRLNQVFIDVMEADAKLMGQGNTDILKAALAAWNSLDENTKKHWILESARM